MAQIFSLLNSQIIPRCLQIEISTSLQIPTFQIIGLPGPEVAEAKDRVKSAIENSGLPFPKRKVILNLSPAHVKKKGTGLDLAMALSILLDGQRLKQNFKIFAWGELGLDGSLKSVGQTTRALSAALQEGADWIIFPKEDEEELKTKTRLFLKQKGQSKIFTFSQLKDIEEALRSPNRFLGLKIETQSSENQALTPSTSQSLLPLSRDLLKVIALACASSHHLMLLGPKGSGKSHALEWLSALAPKTDQDTKLVQIFMSEMRNKTTENLSAVRRVGSQVKASSLLGSFHSGTLNPGEFSLAHGGVLLADEFPEWSRDSREALREPLERGWVTLTRVQGSIELPARFIFAANGNLCPCGGVYSEHIEKHQTPCRCLPHHRQKYVGRLSGPVLDRIDLVYRMKNQPVGTQIKETRHYLEIKNQVQNLRDEQITRFKMPIGLLQGSDLEEILIKRPELQTLLDHCDSMSLRDRHKTFRLAMSLALWDKKEWPEKIHFVEARILRGNTIHE
jgi:magnesium chelatase family protein